MSDELSIVHFKTARDDDASRIAAVLGALGYRAVRLVETVDHAEAWGVSEFARRHLLTAREVSYIILGNWGSAPKNPYRAYFEDGIIHKLDGRSPSEALADIVEVERRPIDHAVDMMAELPPLPPNSEET